MKQSKAGASFRWLGGESQAVSLVKEEETIQALSGVFVVLFSNDEESCLEISLRFSLSPQLSV